MEDNIKRALQRRDGLNCFLCGKGHTSLARMGVGYIDKSVSTRTDTAFLACTGCNRRRDNRPIKAYLQERAQDAYRELNYIEAFMSPRGEFTGLKKSLQLPIVIRTDTGEEIEADLPARKIQDVPWRELLSRETTWPVFESFIKEAASDHEAALIDAIGRMAKFHSGMEKQTVSRLINQHDDMHLDCDKTRKTLMCKWEGRPQYIVKSKKR